MNEENIVKWHKSDALSTGHEYTHLTTGFTAIGDQIFGESPEDGVIAKVYGAPKLAKIMAAASYMLYLLKDARQLVYEQAGDNSSLNESIVYMDAAIAKAEGN